MAPQVPTDLFLIIIMPTRSENTWRRCPLRLGQCQGSSALSSLTAWNWRVRTGAKTWRTNSSGDEDTISCLICLLYCLRRVGWEMFLTSIMELRPRLTLGKSFVAYVTTLK